MKFTLIEACAKTKGYKFTILPETLHVADWVKRELDPNELGDRIDSFFDGYGDIVRGEDGKHYMAESFCFDDKHFGEYGIWCEIKEIAK